MHREVVWTAAAERDLLEVHQQIFIASGEDDTLVTKLLEIPLEQTLSLLGDHPEIAPRVRGKQELRRRLLSPLNRYGLYYCVEDRGIIIHALLDLRQDPKAIAERLRRI